MQPRSVLKLIKYIHLYGDKAFLIFIFIGLIPFYCFTMEYSLAFYFALKYLSIPILIITLFIFTVSSSKNHKLKVVIVYLARGLIAIVVSSGYIVAFNALIGSSKEILVEGNITNIETHIGSRGHRDYFVHLSGVSADTPDRLQVDREEYESLKNQKLYSKIWKKGSLGFLYN